MNAMNSATYSFVKVIELPSVLASHILYVSDEYEIACHLCACGCGCKVYTPLGKAEWQFLATDGGLPSLRPSIGNWTLPCRSHYWLRQGRISWASDWSDDQVKVGRAYETEQRRILHASENVPKLKPPTIWQSFANWFAVFLSKFK